VALSNKIKINEDLTKANEKIREKYIGAKINCKNKINLSILFNTWKRLREDKKQKQRVRGKKKNYFCNYIYKFLKIIIIPIDK
jgi:hypothetical protein